MPTRRLKEFLDQQNIPYVSLPHTPAYTAQQVAASTHVSGREFAKTVIIRIGDRMAMAVLPASRKLVLSDVREIVGDEEVRFATEEEFQSLFPDCEIGAMPPFGNLYGIDVYVDPSLAEDEEIVFNAGTHAEAIKMKYREFEQLVNPKHVPSFTV